MQHGVKNTDYSGLNLHSHDLPKLSCSTLLFQAMQFRNDDIPKRGLIGNYNLLYCFSSPAVFENVFVIDFFLISTSLVNQISEFLYKLSKIGVYMSLTSSDSYGGVSSVFLGGIMSFICRIWDSGMWLHWHGVEQHEFLPPGEVPFPNSEGL